MSRPNLVVNADDLGVCRGATLGVVEAHRAGIVTSASLAVTTPFYRHALETCVRTNPALGIGLHFTLTLGRPVSDPRRVPLLVDAQGRFRWRFTSLLRATALPGRRQLLAQIAAELEAQLDQLARDGIRVDHIDGERHVHLIPGVLECVVDAARRRGISYVRAGRDLGRDFARLHHAVGMLASGGVVKSALLSALAARARRYLTGGVTTPDAVASYLYTGRTGDILPAVLSAPTTAHVVEVMVHPGIPEENGVLGLGNRGVEQYLMSPDRRAELQACVAARALPSVWAFTTYRELARATV